MELGQEGWTNKGFPLRNEEWQLDKDDNVESHRNMDEKYMLYKILHMVTA